MERMLLPTPVIKKCLPQYEAGNVNHSAGGNDAPEKARRRLTNSGMLLRIHAKNAVRAK